VALLLGLGGGLSAQETFDTSAGEAVGINGTSSYMIGQLVYTTNTGVNGSLIQGVQQTYSISTSIVKNKTDLDVALSIYPNPAINKLSLKIEKLELSTLNFKLIDL